MTGVGPVRLNPIDNWASAFSNEPGLHAVSVNVVRDFVDSSIGQLEALVDEAKSEERSLAGLGPLHQLPFQGS